MKHEILPLNEMLKYKQGNFLWKICNGYTDKPLSDIFICNTYNPKRFNLPKKASNKNNLVYTCVKYWNSIPLNIRNSSTINSFNAKHKKHLMSKLS